MDDCRFYVYVHKDINGDIRYIGKGQGRRAYNFSNRRNHHKAWIDKCKAQGTIPTVEIVKEGLTELEAFDLEVELIQLHRPGGLLTNIANGGAGGHAAYGDKREALLAKLRKKRHTAETKSKMSAAAKGRTFSAATRAKMRDAKLGKPRTTSAIELMIKSNTGKRRSEETRELMSAIQRMRADEKAPYPQVVLETESAERRAILRQLKRYILLKYRWADAEFKGRGTGWHHSEESKNKIRISNTKYKP